MSEGTNNQTPASTPPQREDSKAYAPPATQADLDRIVESRLARERARYADYDNLKAKADKFDAHEAANKTELQKAQDAAASAEKRAADAEAKVLRATVAAAKGVPAELLTGDTEAELTASADALIAFKGLPKVPPASGNGSNIHKTGTDASGDWLRNSLTTN